MELISSRRIERVISRTLKDSNEFLLKQEQERDLHGG